MLQRGRGRGLLGHLVVDVRRGRAGGGGRLVLLVPTAADFVSKGNEDNEEDEHDDADDDEQNVEPLERAGPQ